MARVVIFMSMIILRSLFKEVTILENNAVQTMASAGESLAAGVIFTVPALLVIPNLWDEIQLLETTIIALLGGLMGTMFTIALRRLFIVEEALPYPEGVACREVLVAGEEGGEGGEEGDSARGHPRAAHRHQPRAHRGHVAHRRARQDSYVRAGRAAAGPQAGRALRLLRARGGHRLGHCWQGLR